MLKQFNLILGVLFVLFTSTALAQIANHSYPRTAIFQWGYGAAEIYAKYDLVITAQRSSQRARNIKEIDPTTVVLCTRDFNTGMDLNEDLAEEFYLHTSKGSTKAHRIPIYGSNRWSMTDFTDFCPRINFMGYNNIRYNEFAPAYLVGLVDLSVYDGVATAGIWTQPPTDWTDIDLDRNGVNDYNEHGLDWIRNEWFKGTVKLVKNTRNLLGNDKVFIVNGSTPAGVESLYNGYIFEYGSPFTNDWYTGEMHYNSLMARLREPQFLVIDGNNNWGGVKQDVNVRNDFYLMRFVLGTALLGNGYMGHQPQYWDHYMLSYYDEMDLDLGMPTSNPHTRKCDGNKCVYVRFFEKGVLILNASGQPQTITDSDIRFAAYDGPYYFFQGGQDPEHNDGHRFQTELLRGDISSWSKRYYGDALILLKEPEVVIADILVDHHENETSPGTDPAVFSGIWNKEAGVGSWTTGYRDWLVNGHSYSYPGNGNNTAIFQPEIGFSGNYELYEWHGNTSTGNQVASNAPFTVNLEGNDLIKNTIDQTQNQGQWNRLGKFYFEKNANLKITLNDQANGIVLADAFKLVYAGSEIDNIPPNNPTGLRMDESTENSIQLAWNAPPTANDGDGAMFYEVFRNGQAVGTSYITTFLDKDLNESTQYAYRVSAVDDGGNSCQNPTTGSFSTRNDMSPPVITNIWTSGSDQVEVVFNEVVDPVSALNASNYRISNNITVSQAQLDESATKVILTTSQHATGTTYQMTVNNVKDASVVGNAITPNSTASYEALLDPMLITVSGDDGYELYVNGNKIGEGSGWSKGTRFEAPTLSGKNVIAIKGIDLGGKGGLVAQIKFLGKDFVSNENWQVITSEQTDWTAIHYDDSSWPNAVSYGLHGSTLPWSEFGDVENISNGIGVKWIWSADQENDDEVYFRLALHTENDDVPPNPPVGIEVAY